jgi:hypothetical protein
MKSRHERLYFVNVLYYKLKKKVIPTVFQTVVIDCVAQERQREECNIVYANQN